MPLNNKTLFIHIPKCGGHSVEAAMGIPHKKFARHEYSFKYLFGNELQHLTFMEAELILPQSAFDRSFTIVRDPIERIISEYYWSGNWTGVDAFLEERVKTAFERNDRNLDRHLLPQVNFISGKASVDEIFGFGQFDEVADYLGVKGIPHLNKKRKNSFEPELYRELASIARNYYSDDFDLYHSFSKKIIKPKQFYFLKTLELQNNKKIDSYLAYACENFIIFNNGILQDGLKTYYRNWLDIEECNAESIIPEKILDVDEVKVFWVLQNIRKQKGLIAYIIKVFELRSVAIKMSHRFFLSWFFYKLTQKGLKYAKLPQKIKKIIQPISE